ncbi:MAG: DUF4184 family protein [Anaerolineales bacterium]|nr:DUF4184 family protein [Anaerolineales bacterium]
MYNRRTYKAFPFAFLIHRKTFIPATFPSPFPAHQGLVYPLVRRWPASYDVIALSAGAAMPDFVDIVFGFLLNGYFRHWFAHSLVFIPFNILGGLLLTWLIKVSISKLFKKENSVDQNNTGNGKSRLNIWTFSVTVGVLSHLGFDLISHDVNLLLYPWVEDVRWLPDWWYASWYVIQPPLSMGPPYSIGFHSLVWLILSTLGTFLFYQFVFEKIKHVWKR